MSNHSVFPPIGYIGLGKMGSNMVLRLLEKNYNVVIYNKTPEPTKELEKSGAIGAYSVKELIDKLAQPKIIWLMVPYTAVDSILKELMPNLTAGDVIIDGGNSYYKDSVRRAASLEAIGVAFLDVGVNNGPDGVRNGSALTIGGIKEAYDFFEPLFKDLSAPDAYAYFGKSGSGHFVKMIHNGIEYGMIQSIAEGFSVLKTSDFAIDLEKAAKVYSTNSVISSRLLTWLLSAFSKYGSELKDISGSAAQLGEGAWTSETANELGVRAPAISAAVNERNYSQEHPSFQGKVISALRGEFGGHAVN